MKLLVTGASGFIGSAFIRRALRETDHSIVALIRDTDQRNMRRLEDEFIRHAEATGRMRRVHGDLVDANVISGVCEGVDAVVNFAARTFVDHSIKDAAPFVYSNVIGTMNLLEDARRNKIKRFIQVSTDEVYGAILEGAHTENSRANPTNPYAASKLGADALAIAYAHTFGLHTTVTRTENNYGPLQHPQKALPTFVKKALTGEKIPIYGDGKHSRQWLWVDDHVDGLLLLLTAHTPPGEVYHIAGCQELENRELATIVLRYLEIPETQVEYIDDHNIRPGHDRRYALNCSKLRALGWEPKKLLIDGMKEAIEWYASNQWWWS